MNSPKNIIPQHYTDTLLDHMPVGVALFDARDLRLLAANAFFHKLLTPAWQDGRAIGHPPVDWVIEANATNFEKMLRKVIETGIPYRAEGYAVLSPRLGTTYWNLTIDAIWNSDGQIIQLLQTATDVTTYVLARQEAEQAHASLSKKSRTVEAERKRLEVIETVARSVRKTFDIESIGKAAVEVISANFHPLRLGIYTADPAQRALRLLPVPLYAAAGSEPDEQSVNALQYIPYDGFLLISQAYKYRDPIVIEDLQAADILTRVDSSNPLYSVPGAHGYIIIPLWFKDYFEGALAAFFDTAIRPDSPEVRALMGSGTHIGAALAHARLRAALEDQRARLRAILDQLPEGVLLVEASDGCVSYANAAAAYILGVPLTSLVGIPINQYPQAPLATGANSRPMIPWNFAVIRALSSETVSSQEMTVTKPCGNKVVILSSTAPLRAEKGLITGAVIVFQDITAHKSIERQKQEFLSIASHELRTPITAIQGFAEILQLLAAHEQDLRDPRSLRAITSISEQSAHLTSLIEEMLDISRIENMQLSLDLGSYDLLATLVDVIESQGTTTRQHHLQLVLEGLQPTDTFMGWFDQHRIEQVLSNLISNAIKYSPAGGEIVVGLHPLDDTTGASHEALIWVQDHGIGIDPSELPHIFEQFHRAGNLDRSISGLGIGLYLARELVERHGGRIWVESSEGKGSTFYIRLPLNKREGYPASTFKPLLDT